MGGTSATNGDCYEGSVDSVFVAGFYNHIVYGNNCWGIAWLNSTFTTALSGGSCIQTLSSVSNTGERLTYIGCVFGNNGCAVFDDVLAGFGHTFVACSFDYNGNAVFFYSSNNIVGHVIRCEACHFEWNDSGAEVVAFGDSTTNQYSSVRITNSTFVYTGTGALTQFFYLGSNGVSFTSKNNIYNPQHVKPTVIFNVGPDALSGVLDVDDESTATPSLAVGWFNELPAGLMVFTQKGVYSNQALSGTTAGLMFWSMQQQGTGKVFQAYASGYENDTATNQTITFPTAFANPPYIAHNDSGLTISASTTALTITAPNAATTYSGNIEVRGM
jgi:hypothetical protein